MNAQFINSVFPWLYGSLLDSNNRPYEDSFSFTHHALINSLVDTLRTYQKIIKILIIKLKYIFVHIPCVHLHNHIFLLV